MRKSAFLALIGVAALLLQLLARTGVVHAASPIIVLISPPSPITFEADGNSRTILVGAIDPDLGQTSTLIYTLSGNIPLGMLIFQPNDPGDPAEIEFIPTLPTVGTYLFNVIVTDVDGNTDQEPIILNVIVPLPPTITLTPSITNTPSNTPTPTATITPGGPTLTPTTTFTSTVTLTPSITNTPTRTLTPTITLTPTFPPLPTLTPLPTATPIPTSTFIPALATRTPLPRPANAGAFVGLFDSGVRFVVNRDGVNVRIIPAIGAQLAGTVNAGFTGTADAISADREWLRFEFESGDAWIGFPVISVFEGDINSLPVADPRTIPYGGFENPLAGLTSATSAIQARSAFRGVNFRVGPGIGYARLGATTLNSQFALLGRNRSGSWVQINYEGSLGWIAVSYLQFVTPGALQALQPGGIVAEALPYSDDGFDTYGDVLRLLLSRVELAIPSLEIVRARFTAVALGGSLQCGDYPARPSDYNIPIPVLAAFFGTLDSLQTDFNTAMGNLRRVIDLLVNICEQGGSADGATIQQALDLINLVDSQFADLRRRLIELIPPLLEFDPNEACLFTFNNRSEVVRRLRINVAQTFPFDRNEFVAGFCFDGEVGRTYKLEVLAYSGNARPRVSVSAFDNPTNFLAVANASADRTIVTLQQILIPTTGRYLVIVSDFEPRTVPLQSDIAILLTDVTGLGFSTAPNLSIGVNGELIVAPVPNAGGIPGIPGQPGFPGQPGQPGVPGAFFCPNVTFTCQQLVSIGGNCDTARACYAAGNTSLDEDADGIPCEQTLCFPSEGNPFE